ncbi:MAG TPA: cyclopropane-fatty-acyl-phospholipid synthase family protein [Alphaproteobacteria bacterium]
MLLASYLFRQIIKIGRLTIIDHLGRQHVFAGAAGPSITIRLHDAATARKIALNPRLHIGEAYMDGRLTIEDADIYSFLEFCALNSTTLDRNFLLDFAYRIQILLRRFQQYNPVGRSRENVAHHYDLSGRLYELFLDTDRQYSCAYFTSNSDSLEIAQENKKRHIAAKLLLKPGCRVLDIGSGWGGLGIYLAKVGAADVTGITLSAEQHKVSNERAAAAQLSGRVRFEMRDYREQTGKFDRIVSVGMFEHVGVNHYREFFEKIRDLLTDDGVALLHSIGRADGPGTTNPWLRKYIFPGGYSPALSEVLPVVERAGLFVTDIEILRLHYAHTLREWRRRFEKERDQIKALYDERFCRMWEFYLAGSELAFRYQGHIVFQMQLAKRVDAVPLTRDYILEWERTNADRGTIAA